LRGAGLGAIDSGHVPATALSRAAALAELEGQPEIRALARRVNAEGQKLAVHWYDSDGGEQGWLRLASATASDRTVPGSVAELDAAIEAFTDAARAGLGR
jgi:hypothetical protein